MQTERDLQEHRRDGRVGVHHHHHIAGLGVGAAGGQLLVERTGLLLGVAHRLDHLDPVRRGDLDGGVGAVVRDHQHPVRGACLLCQRLHVSPRMASSLCAGISTVHRRTVPSRQLLGFGEGGGWPLGRALGAGHPGLQMSPSITRRARRTAGAAAGGRDGPEKAHASPPPSAARPDPRTSRPEEGPLSAAPRCQGSLN